VSGVREVLALGGGKYRVLADGWLADVEYFWAEGSREWCADVLYTNSALPEYQVADIAVKAIQESF
jgi:hypothetical protein